MNAIAFAVIAFTVGMYILRDGYDLGVGAISLFVAKSDDERREVMTSIGPFWSGNEVWLIAAGGALFALFPQAYASAFSAFYLPFIVVLWLLMVRGIALELRDHFASPLWRGFFDVSFAVSSAVLIVLFGVALGDLVRGVPLGANHYFLGTFAFLLNPYALGVGLLALITLSLHGAAFLMTRSEGLVRERAVHWINRAWPLALVIYACVTIATAIVHPFARSFAAEPALYIIPVLALAGLIGMRVALNARRLRSAFDCSALFVGGLMLSAAATMYPYLLTGFPSPQTGLTVYQSAPDAASLTLSCTMIAAGLIAVCIYQFALGRRLAMK